MLSHEYDEGDFCRFALDIRVFNQPALCRNAKENLLAETGICRHQCFSAVVETPQDSPNGYVRKKELDGTIEPIARMNAE